MAFLPGSNGVASLLALGAGGLAKYSANQQANELVSQGQVALQQARREGAALQGHQLAAMGASGFDVGSTSYQALRLDDARQLELEALARRSQYRAEATRLRKAGTYSAISQIGTALSLASRGRGSAPATTRLSGFYGAGGYRGLSPTAFQIYGSDPGGIV